MRSIYDIDMCLYIPKLSYANYLIFLLLVYYHSMTDENELYNKYYEFL